EFTGVDGSKSRNNVSLRGESSGPRDNNPYSHIAFPKFTLRRVKGFGLCSLGLRCALDVGDAKEVNLQTDNF
ncbi:hypothetical protein Tco_1115219, partial [Tanacetum coccineum]